MRESSDGRRTVLPWSDASKPQRFAVGDTVVAEPYDTPGTVTAVGATTVNIVWSDGDGGAIVYPVEASFLKPVRKLPWQ
jgi:hypothetical protein